MEFIKPFLDLDYTQVSAEKKIWMHMIAAKEFASSLRKALEAYPDHTGLEKMASEENETDNLSFLSYNRKGDHREFLQYFLDLNKYIPSSSDLGFAKAYIEFCALKNGTIAASFIATTEDQYHMIFDKLLSGTDRNSPKVNYFKYYVERHKTLDAEEGGHADLLKDFRTIYLNEEVNDLWQARYTFFQNILFPSTM